MPCSYPSRGPWPICKGLQGTGRRSSLAPGREGEAGTEAEEEEDWGWGSWEIQLLPQGSGWVA